MATRTHERAATADPAKKEDLLRIPDDGYKNELVDGQIRMSPAGFRCRLSDILVP